MPLRLTELEYRQYLKAKGFADPSLRAPDVEPNPIAIPQRPHEVEAPHSRFRINIHSRRGRLADSDGISAKAAIDGLVAGGILGDDSPAWVESVTYSQELSEIEETIIEVWELG